MGDPTIDVTDASREAAQLCKERAMHVLSTGMILFTHPDFCASICYYLL